MRWRHGSDSPAVMVAGVGALRVNAGFAFVRWAHGQPQQQRHQHDHHGAAEIFGERELPANQHPKHQAQFPHRVGRCER
jgi:hypothetical protein